MGYAPPDDRQVPDMAFAFYDQMVVFDHVCKTIVVVAMAFLSGGPVSVAQWSGVALIALGVLLVGWLGLAPRAGKL